MNPYLPSYEYVPDGEPHVFDDRLYVYGSHDLFGASDFCMGDYVCYSASLEDLDHWRYDGVIYKKEQDPRNSNGKMHMCAPDVTQGKDGRYYLYYQLHVLQCTSVAVADRPEGPYDFYGYVRHVDGTPWGEKRGDAFAFDPGVLRDDDGKYYLYVGFGAFGFMRTVFKIRGNNVGEGVCLELADDMLTVVGEKEWPTIPAGKKAKGTGFEGHGFFEASSPRKINGKYYLVYSSELSHELCYAVSESPVKDFRYGGTIVSIGDIGYQGNTKPDNYTGNTHGGLVEVNGQWYVFYHRQTNKIKCARQGCAELIAILPDGTIPQIEMTTQGLRGKPLPAKGTYEACCACNLSGRNGTFAYVAGCEKKEWREHPYFTQTGVDRESGGDQYIANLQDGAWCGFKYFAFDGSESKISVKIKGNARGTLQVTTKRGGIPIAEITVTPSAAYTDFTTKIKSMICKQTALYFTYVGSGALDFMSFAIEEQ